MEVTLLGTGSPIPDPLRAGPATLVRAGGLALLFDCGRGVLLRLAAAGVPGPPGVAVQFLTHLHSDHTTDLNDVITTRWVMSMVPLPLPLVGPPGSEGLVDRTLAMLTEDIGYRIAHHDDIEAGPEVHVTEVLDGPVALPELGAAGITVTAAPTDHRPVTPTVGYRIEHEGASVAIAGDTVPCEGLDRLVRGADVYVQTVVRDDVIRQIPLPRLQDVCDYHSTVVQAAQTAARAGVGTLVLTHMVPAPPPGGAQEWIDIATEHFDGTVLAPDDLATITVGAGAVTTGGAS
ncbi:ribonuclease Z [Dermatobacter hominis]|nr:ribonuclease Z [Dermatobacter hominis]UDY35371.1 ribonuclease Z [Dermatobacter hominis]